MRCERLAINWMLGWGNPPQAVVMVDEIPHDMRFVKEGNLYWAEEGGLVRQYTWSGGQQEGFGGRRFPITLRSGEEVVLKGPWDGSTTIALDDANTMPLHVNVSIVSVAERGREKAEAIWDRGHTFYSAKVTAEWLRAAIREHIEDGRVVLGQADGGAVAITYLSNEVLEGRVRKDVAISPDAFAASGTAPRHDRLGDAQLLASYGMGAGHSVVGSKPSEEVAADLPYTYHRP